MPHAVSHHYTFALPTCTLLAVLFATRYSYVMLYMYFLYTASHTAGILGIYPVQVFIMLREPFHSHNAIPHRLRSNPLLQRFAGRKRIQLRQYQILRHRTRPPFRENALHHIPKLTVLHSPYDNSSPAASYPKEALRHDVTSPKSPTESYHKPFYLGKISPNRTQQRCTIVRGLHVSVHGLHLSVHRRSKGEFHR